MKIFNANPNPNLFRIIYAMLACVLVVVIFMDFYRVGTVPTDENWFSSPPSRFYLTKSFPAEKVVQPANRADFPELVSDSIRAGNLILAIDKKMIGKFNTLDHFYQSIPDDSVFRMAIFMLSKPKSKASYLVKKSALPDSFIRIIPPAAHVFDVIEGGASDRAGMKPGDLIVSVNQQRFRDVWEADRIMRRARADNTIEYKVIRDNRTLTLHVTLARFGFDTSILIPYLCGLIIIGFALFLALKRPSIKAARLLGMAFLAFGFYIATSFKHPYLYKDTFLDIRVLLTHFSFAFAIAWGLDSTFFFPKSWVDALKHKWIRVIPYLFAVVFIVTVITSSDYLMVYHPNEILIIISVALIYNLLIHLFFRKKRPKELRRMTSPLGWAVYLTFIIYAGVHALLIHYKLPRLDNYALIITLVIPLAYLYTIGSYHLLDINIRIRRNVQYSIISTLWILICLSGFAVVLMHLIDLDINIPRFRITFTSFELLEGSISPQRKEIIQRLLLILSATLIGFGFWKIGQWGRRIIDTKYYRKKLDYPRFSRELAEVMATKLGMVDLATGIIQKLAELLHLKSSGIIFFRDGVSCCYQVNHHSDELKSRDPLTDIQSKLYDYLKDFRTDTRFSIEYLPNDIQNSLIESGFRHIVPIWFKDRLNGVLLIGEKLSETPFHREDLSFFTTVAKQASISIENAFLYEQLAEKERMKHELEIARKIQLASLPQTTPVIEGVEISGISIPAFEVGGDYFDYLNGVPNTVMVIVGDVSGKGTSAALYLFKIQGILRSLFDFGLMPRELFIRANTLIYHDLERKSFVTAIGGYFDAKRRSLIVARAGHLPLFYYSAKHKSVQEIAPKGLGLGLDKQDLFAAEIDETVIQYSQGDVFLFVTDGITEAKNIDGKEFGEQNVLTLLERANSHNACKIRDQLLEEIHEFSMNTVQHDDQTVVVVKIL